MAIKVDVELDCEKIREQLREIVREIVDEVARENSGPGPVVNVNTNLCPNSQRVAKEIAELIHGRSTKNL